MTEGGSVCSVERLTKSVIKNSGEIDTGVVECEKTLSVKNGRQTLISETVMYRHTRLGIRRIPNHGYLMKGGTYGEEVAAGSIVKLHPAYANKQGIRRCWGEKLSV